MAVSVSKALRKEDSYSLPACTDTGSGNNFAPEALCREKKITVNHTKCRRYDYKDANGN